MLSKHWERIMARLTDTQQIIISNAAARDDRIAVVPPKMNKTAASNVGASLVARKLMRELRSRPGMPVWRQDENGRSISLMITRAGRDAIGVDEGGRRRRKRLVLTGRAGRVRHPTGKAMTQLRRR